MLAEAVAIGVTANNVTITATDVTFEADETVVFYDDETTPTYFADTSVTINDESITPTITTVEELKAALAVGADVTLGDNINIVGQSVEVKDSVNVTIDLNGYTITGAGQYSASGSSDIWIDTGSTLTLSGEGSVISEATEDSGYGLITVKGTLIVEEGVTIDASESNYAIMVNGGEVTLNGCTVLAEAVAIGVNEDYGTGTVTDNGAVIDAPEAVVTYKSGEVTSTTYTVTFTSTYSTPSFNSAVTDTDGTLSELPTISYSGYTFKGWYDASGNQVSTSTIFSESTTVTASWSKNSTGSSSSGSSTTYFEIELSYEGEGSVTPATTKMAKNTSKTFYFTPDEGYEISDVLVNGESIGSVESYTISSISEDHTIEVIFTEIDSEETVIGDGFTDVDGDAYYYDAVLWAVENGITSGTTDTTFSPNTTCTRAQAVTFLYRAAGEPDVSGIMTFTDVDADAYYYDAVLWAVANGITAGTTDTTFSPDAVCSRSQIVTFMYRTDSEGNRLRDEKGIALFDAVATTDWGKPETLEFWRSKWAETVNEALSRKGVIDQVDNRSYQRQGIDQIPTIHEGVAVREMEAKGIATGKGNRNRWITATNTAIRDLKGKITALLIWLKEVRETPQPPTSPSLIELLQSYYNQRNRTVWSGKAKLGNLKDFSKAINYLTEQQLHTLADLEGKVTSVSDRVDALKGTMDSKGKRVKGLDELLRYAEMYGKTLPVFEEMSSIKFKGRRETFKASHDSELRQYYMAKRKLTPYFTETGKLPLKSWRNEQDQLRQEQAQDYEAYKPLREELTQLLKVRHCTEIAQRDQPHIEPQNRDQHDR